MSGNTDILIKKLADTLNTTGSKKPAPYDTQAEVKRIDGNIAWVHIPGGVDETPVQLTTSAKKGDTVQVRISGGRAWLYGNQTSPPTDDTVANKADKKATYAEEISQKALEMADNAERDAERAFIAANQAEQDAERAATAAESAEDSASQAAISASNAESAASTAESSAAQAVIDAGNASTAASNAQNSAAQAALDASSAASSASSASSAASQARADANSAKASATNASKYASQALGNLSTVQSVTETLNWITQHGTMSITTDQSLNPSHVYFVINQNGDYVVGNTHYSIVAEPKIEDIGTYYELTIDESLNNYVATHIALTDYGLNLLFDNSSYRIHIGTLTSSGDEGVYILDENGGVVSFFGESINFSSTRPQYIGNSNAYIIFDPSNGGSITIGGANITLGDNRPLDDVLASMNSTISNTLIYDHTYVYGDYVDNKPTTATFTAFLYRGGVDVKNELDDEDNPKYQPSQFTWYLKKEDDNGVKEVPIVVDPQSDPPNSGYQCTVNLSDCGYGAEVIGKFTSLDDAEALTTDADNLTTVDNDPISVRASGDSVRVRDLTTSSTIFPTDKLMVVGSEDEHLVTIQTLQDYLNANLDKQVLFDTAANWNSQTTLVSRSDTLYIYTDHQRDSGGHAIAGIKAGDGLAYVVDLPFTDAIATEHIADNSIHITSSERSTWNNHVSNNTIHVTASDKEKWNSAVKCYYAGTDQLVFTVV